MDIFGKVTATVLTHFLVQTLKNKDCNAHDSEIDMVASILLQEMILFFYIPKTTAPPSVWAVRISRICDKITTCGKNYKNWPRMKLCTKLSLVNLFQVCTFDNLWELLITTFLFYLFELEPIVNLNFILIGFPGDTKHFVFWQVWGSWNCHALFYIGCSD